MATTMERRAFLKGAAATAAGVSIMQSRTAFGASANSTVNLAVIGCGGRGTNVASSFVENTPTRIAAIADLFEDRLTSGREAYNQANAKQGRAPIEDSHAFLGSEAYLRLLELPDVDAVLISSPPFLHPEHLEATVRAGKNVYCEKPVGVDVHGCRRVIQAGKQAESRLSLAVGFQIRHATPFVEMVRRIHEGQIGAIVTIQGCYLAGRVNLPEFPNAGPIELRLRRWLNDRALSGDILVEQGIHVLDICNWVMKTHPEKAFASAARAGRVDEGDTSSHYIVNFTYPGGVHLAFQSTQFDPGLGDVWERFLGDKGIAEAHYTGGVFIKGPDPWDSGVARGTPEEISSKDWAVGAFKSSLDDADPNKQKAFIQSIQAGQRINEAQAGAESALTAIMARTAAYTGEEVTWDEIVTSDQRWDPMIDLRQFDKSHA